MNIYIDTLGCAKNEYDSQMLAASLVLRGCSIVTEPEDADIMIVNTCGFIEDAKKESIARIFELAGAKGRDMKLVVTGCLSERYHRELAEEMPEVDLFFGVNDYDRLPDILLKDEAGASDMVGSDLDDLRYRKREFEEPVDTRTIQVQAYRRLRPRGAGHGGRRDQGTDPDCAGYVSVRP